MSIQIVQPTPYDDAQFLWCTTWCEKKGLNPYDADHWAAAKAEYLKTQGGQQ
ncbi:hypothetical protein QUG64_03270 [Acinetobacter lwoffii]|uniref:Uncharacterized protein n=2 Tax=Acinetobacter lwoffii TaxID=28090 RepID=N9G6T7_ACILW|nr:MULTISPECIES: hypothetical protein [Acinetobacter]ENU16671.1 hypothetical protein F995_02156 [Acinetobacter sp. CIP A162]ENW30678.1 hypothetical protein F923_01248 [Acinetobacter lwoffii NIPH 478]ENX00962.1 hypothetical protein F899_01595 [Acinetobacter sp. CIP 101934]ESJ96026.1 hypothetical protein P800_00848 [Acinetobacter lwoffii NCTC 5866 = CIP 64.10 = NIPH 512]QXB40459.1 hypothetical protein I6L23_15010 [Acinetobacter lwoffii]